MRSPGFRLGRRLASIVLLLSQGAVWQAGGIYATPDVQVPISHGVPLRILPLGDSITWGYNERSGNSYRRDLECLVYTGGNPVALVGSAARGDWADNAADAFVLHTIDEVREAAAPELFAASPGRPPPNVVLLHAGTVNFVRGVNVTDAPARLGALLDAVAAHHPAALVVAARLVPNADAAVDARIARFNDALPAVVAARARAGRAVVLAPMDGVTTDMLPDGTHPDEGGYRIMARRFYEALREAGRQGLVTAAEGPFTDLGASSLPPSGRCADLVD